MIQNSSSNGALTERRSGQGNISARPLSSSRYPPPSNYKLENLNQPVPLNKDTIVTTSSNILSERTLNIKKEIINLDEEIIMLQNSLQNAIIKNTSGIAST